MLTRDDLQSEGQVAYGFCKCGCGQKTPISKKTNAELGHVKGLPRKYVPYHHRKYRKNGDGNGYIMGKKVEGKRLHVLEVEKLLGITLPGSAVVHHIDGDGSNNNPTNLVVCENQAYHNMIHIRARALSASGHANWRKCTYCKRYDDPGKLIIRPRYSSFHQSCRAIYNKTYMHKW